MVDFCSQSDLYDFGVPRGSIQNHGRLVASVSTSTDELELNVHGLSLDTAVTFRAETGGSLPSPLQSGVAYYAIPTSESRFQVASAAGGSAVNLTTAGARVVVITALPIAAAISWASEIISDSLPAHVLPITTPVPTILRMTAAELAAGKLGYYAGSVPRPLTQILDWAQKRVERWAAGFPVRGTNSPTTSQLAQGASVSARASASAASWRKLGGFSR